MMTKNLIFPISQIYEQKLLYKVSNQLTKQSAIFCIFLTSGSMSGSKAKIYFQTIFELYVLIKFIKVYSL